MFLKFLQILLLFFGDVSKKSIRIARYYVVNLLGIIKKERSGGTVDGPPKIQTYNLVGPFWLLSST